MIEEMGAVKYPTINELIEINKLVLKLIKAKKADQHKVLSRNELEGVLRSMKEQEGDIYEKAVTLLTGLLLRSHPFASGNRRTAYLAARGFLEINGEEIGVEHDPDVLQGIREDFYARKEIISWLKGNGIRRFRRA